MYKVLTFQKFELDCNFFKHERGDRLLIWDLQHPLVENCNKITES